MKWNEDELDGKWIGKTKTLSVGCCVDTTNLVCMDVISQIWLVDDREQWNGGIIRGHFNAFRKLWRLIRITEVEHRGKLMTILIAFSCCNQNADGRLKVMIRIIGSPLRYLLIFKETNLGIENEELVTFASLDSTDVEVQLKRFRVGPHLLVGVFGQMACTNNNESLDLVIGLVTW